MNIRIRTLILLIVLASCGMKKEPASAQVSQWVMEPPRPPHPIVVFDSVHERGILIGGDIQLMDTAFCEIQDITDYNELMVDIVAVSKLYYRHYFPFPNYDKNPDSLNPCDLFKYVIIKTRDFVGMVEGNNVYKKTDSPQNRVLQTMDNRLEFIMTANYSNKPLRQEEDVPCPSRTPVLFREKKSNYEGLITLMNYQEHRIYFPYLEFGDPGDEENSTVKLQIQGDDYELSIDARFEMYDTKGDAPIPPSSIRIRKESNGKFSAIIP